ncbi:unnamed protein product [Meganyctiphanes norvegica]|uniref:Lipase domain-containing protein n=1 Tax=Meganyctiphanes norvegica TaxID=48144 RepID=A0AAV2QNE6_MEGNR
MGGLGAFQPMGHVDFYPNGGRMQKGCTNLFVGGVSDILWPKEGEGNGRYLCNHRRGYKYFTASVTPQCIFPSFVCRDYETFLKGDCFPCKNCGKMGYFSEEAVGRGQLYLVTSEMDPFCANQYKVAVVHSGGPPAEEFTTYGRIDVTFVAQGGLNQTLPLTRTEDQEMVAGGTTIRIMVPHPAITDIQAVQLRYIAYHGWIYSGYKSWAINKISVTDSFGKIVTFCNIGTTLVSSKTMHFTLLPGDCSPLDAQPVTFVKPWQVQDSVPEIETNNASEEGDASGKIPLQIAPSPPSELKHKNSQDNGSAPNIAAAIPAKANHRLSLDKPIPKPILTPMEPHGGILAAPGDSQHPLLAITLEVPPKFKTHVQTFTSHSSSHFDIIGVTEPPSLLEDLNEHFVNDVAVSSEEPVNIIPAPNLALINMSLDNDGEKQLNGMAPPPYYENAEEIQRGDSTTPKVFTIFNATYLPNTHFNHIPSSYVSTVKSTSDSTTINGLSHFSTHSALPGSVTATDRADDEEGIYINAPHRTESNNEKFEAILPPQELTNSDVKRLESILPQHQPQEFIIPNKALKENLPELQPQEFIITNESLKAILPQHQPQKFINLQSEASEATLPQHQPQQYIIHEQSDQANLDVKPSNNPLQEDTESGLPGEYYGYYTGDTFSDLSPGDYFLKPLKSSLDESLGDVDPNSPFAFSNSLVLGEVPARERARAINGASLNINVFSSQMPDKEKTNQKDTLYQNLQKSHYNINYQSLKNVSVNGSDTINNSMNSSELISNLANIRIASPYLHHVDSNPPNLDPILTNFRPALHLIPPIPDSLPYIGPVSSAQSNIQLYSSYRRNKNPSDSSITPEQPILRPDAMRPSYSRPIHQNSQLQPPPPYYPPPPHTPILETIIGRGRAPRPYSFKKQNDTHEQNVNNQNQGNLTVKENPSIPQQVYVQILPSSFRNIRHLETSFLTPRDGRKMHGRSGRGHSFVPPILVPQGANTHPVYLQLQNNRQPRYIPLRHTPVIGT